LYRKACQLVFDNQKASTSWLQRQLRIGYNSDARLIERMENDGHVSAPTHVGRREVLMDENGQPTSGHWTGERKSTVSGKRGAVRVDRGGRRMYQKNKKE